MIVKPSRHPRCPLLSPLLPHPPGQRNMPPCLQPMAPSPLPARKRVVGGGEGPKGVIQSLHGFAVAEEEVYEYSTVPWTDTPADGHDLAVDLYPSIRAGGWSGHPGACGV